MPTGTGKTYLLVAVIIDFLDTNGKDVWIVTHRKELGQQVKETIKRFSSFAANGNILKEYIKVYSIQWLLRYYDGIEGNPSLIVEEAHHAVAKTYSSVSRAYPEY